LMQLSPSTQQVKPKTAKKMAVRSETWAFIGTLRIERCGIGRRSNQTSRIFRVDDLGEGETMIRFLKRSRLRGTALAAHLEDSAADCFNKNFSSNLSCFLNSSYPLATSHGLLSFIPRPQSCSASDDRFRFPHFAEERCAALQHTLSSVYVHSGRPGLPIAAAGLAGLRVDSLVESPFRGVFMPRLNQFCQHQ
jgi:hypothetical protein